VNVKITWSCNLDPSGYSSCSRSFIKALDKNPRCSDINIVVNNVCENINSLGLSKEDLLYFGSKTISENDKYDNFIQTTVPDRMIFGNKKDILFTFIEIEPPKKWVGVYNNCDLVITSSSYSKEKMIEAGADGNKIKVVPLCHDISVWNPYVKPLNIKNLKEYNFLFVGDYTPRKNGDILVKEFIKTFSGNKDVSLTLKAYFNGFSEIDQMNLLKRIRKTAESTGIRESDWPSIYFYGEPIKEEYMPSFMNSFDCLISPHRVEGWGLNCSQMMCLGKPVIATGYSGNMDFMNKENSYLIDIIGFEEVCDEMCVINPKFSGKEWTKIDNNTLCDLMNYVYNNKDKALEVGEKAYKHMASNFSYEVVSEKFLYIL